MKHYKLILGGFVFLLALGMILLTGCKKEEVEEQVETKEIAQADEKESEAKKEFPAAVLEKIEAHFSDAEIDFVEVVDEDGITLYDIEFKANRGEIEVASDGSIIDIVTILTMEELPEAAALAIQKATEGMTIKRLEKSEIHSEIKKEGDTSTIVKLDVFKYVYEAEVSKDGQSGEITVDAEGNIVEALKWDSE